MTTDRGGRHSLLDTWVGRFFLEQEAELTRPIPEVWAQVQAPRTNRRIMVSTTDGFGDSGWFDRATYRQMHDDGTATYWAFSKVLRDRDDDDG